MIKLDGVHHVSINVRDVEAAREFYVDVLGLDVLLRPDFPFGGYWLKSGDTQLHLIEVQDFQPPKGQHFAFRVRDIDGILAELSERNLVGGDDYMGIASGKIIEVPGVCRQAFIFDPTGNMVELNEPVG